MKGQKKIHRLTGLMSFSALFLATAHGFAAPSHSKLLPLDTVEKKIWVASTTELDHLEQTVARSIQMDPSNAYAHFLMAQVLSRYFTMDPTNTKLLSQVSQLAEQAVQLEPDQEYGYIALAEVLDLVGQNEKALKVLAATKKYKVKETWRHGFARVRILADSQPAETTVKELETLIEKNSADLDVVLPYLIATVISDDQLNDKTATLQDLFNRFPHPLLGQTLASYYVKDEKLNKAEAIYLRALQQEHGNQEIRANLNILRYRFQNQPHKAIQGFQELLAYKAPLEKTLAASVHLHFGAALVKAGRFAEATKHLTEGTRLSDDREESIKFIAEAFHRSPHKKHLVGLLENIQEEMPGIGLSYALLGEVLSEELRSHDRALTAYSNAIALEPNKSIFYNGKGLVLFRKKSYAQALLEFNKAVSTDPGDPTAHYNQACAYARLGRTPEALASLQEAVGLDTELGKQATEDEDLRSLWRNSQFRLIVEGKMLDPATPLASPEGKDGLTLEEVAH